MAMFAQGIVQATGDGVETYEVQGMQITVRATGADTGGAFALLEFVMPAGSGPPTHFHRAMEESFYMLEGSMDFTLAGHTTEIGPRGFVMIPRTVEHRFTVSARGPARMLLLLAPAGFEEFFLGRGSAEAQRSTHDIVWVEE